MTPIQPDEEESWYGSFAGDDSLQRGNILTKVPGMQGGPQDPAPAFATQEYDLATHEYDFATQDHAQDHAQGYIQKRVQEMVKFNSKIKIKEVSIDPGILSSASVDAEVSGEEVSGDQATRVSVEDVTEKSERQIIAGNDDKTDEGDQDVKEDTGQVDDRFTWIVNRGYYAGEDASARGLESRLEGFHSPVGLTLPPYPGQLGAYEQVGVVELTSAAAQFSHAGWMLELCKLVSDAEGVHGVSMLREGRPRGEPGTSSQ